MRNTRLLVTVGRVVGLLAGCEASGSGSGSGGGGVEEDAGAVGGDVTVTVDEGEAPDPGVAPDPGPPPVDTTGPHQDAGPGGCKKDEDCDGGEWCEGICNVVTGQCGPGIRPNTCLAGGRCYAQDESPDANACLVCFPGASQTVLSPVQCKEGFVCVPSQGGCISTPTSCEPACQNGGICKGPGKCQCPSNAAGPLCEFTDYGTCHGHGKAHADGTCGCDAGWEGGGCATDTNDCAPNPCKNGGTCTDGLDSFTCTCSPGWSGTLCGVNIDDCTPNPCKNGGHCSDLPNDFQCACAPGWAGKTCTTNVDECQSAPCVHGTCVDGVNGYTCTCEPGWGGATCSVDVDDCAPNPCKNAGICTDGLNSFVCECPAGFTGPTCATNVDDCAPNPCKNGGVCADKVNDFKCTCPAGFTGKDCSTDIDECLPQNPCKHGGTCQNGVAAFTCVCPPGYTGTVCEVDVDECNPNPCQNGGFCTQGVATYTCHCPTGFGGTNCETDIDDCAPNPCQNGGQCIDKVGTFQCTCPTGYAGGTCQLCDTYYQDKDGDGVCKPSCAAAPLDCGAHGVCTDASGTAQCACAPAYVGKGCDQCNVGFQDQDGDGDCLPTCATAGLLCGALASCMDATGQALCTCLYGGTYPDCGAPVCGDSIVAPSVEDCDGGPSHSDPICSIRCETLICAEPTVPLDLGPVGLVYASAAGGEVTVAGDALAAGMDARGRLIVAFTDTSADGINDAGVRVQRFGADGGKVGASFSPTDVSSTHHGHAALAVAPHGDFVVAWIDGSTDQVWLRRFDPAGIPLAPEVLVGDAAAAAENPTVAVAIDRNGDHVVAFTTSDGFGTGVRLSRYSPVGLNLWSVLANPTIDGDQRNPAVAMAPAGGTVVAWVDPSGSILLRRFDAQAGAGPAVAAGVAPSPTGDGVRIGLCTVGSEALVAGIQAGGVAVERWSAAGTLVATIPVDTEAGLQEAAFVQVAADWQGGFAVAWVPTLCGDTCYAGGPRVRFFQPNGTPVAAETSVAADPFWQVSPVALAMGPRGPWATVFSTSPNTLVRRVAPRGTCTVPTNN